jgi:tetratricopeptide (TPR) repeat protein
VASQDWFRTGAWDAAARDEFETRLRRARSDNRPQYLRVKALALRASGEAVAAAQLLHRVLREYRDSFDAAFCAGRLGDWALSGGDAVAAEQHYRQALDIRPDLNGTTGEVYIGLAEALNAQGRFQDAVQELNAVPATRLGLNQSICRWNVALVDAAWGIGERQVASEAATRALALLDAPDQFDRHPGIGRAVLTDERISTLRAISSGREPTSPPFARRFRRGK